MNASETPLERARRHVAEGRERVLRQERVIQRLALGGHDTARAHALLVTLSRSLNLAVDDLAEEEASFRGATPPATDIPG